MDADVVVIGAGAAGLAAARQLAAHDLRVALVEARDRIGGRVYSAPTSRGLVPADLGAEFIHGNAPETIAVLRECGSAAIDVEGESWIFRPGADPHRDDSDFTAAAGIIAGAHSLDPDQSVDEFLQRFEDDATLSETVASARAFVEGFEAADPAIASAKAIADEWRTGVDSSSARPLGGYKPMFEYLHAACTKAGAAPMLSAVVRRIAWQRGDVTVDVTAADGASRTIRARAAIVTVPAGVLRHSGGDGAIVFDPELPRVKREALANIEMGTVVKVALWFRTPFWERIADGRYRDGSFFRSGRETFATYWTQLPVRSDLVMAWVGGPRANALRGRSKDELVDRALTELGSMFDAAELARSEFEGAAMHDWDRDSYARGAYSYVAAGGGDARAILAAPLDGTLFFAGEATSNDGQGGTVNGALETGERAAREAVELLKGP